MAYEKYTWVDGELITAEKLNHMEDGIAGAGGGGVLVVNANEDSSTESLVLDKTWAEIQEAVVSHGAVVYIKLRGQDGIYSPVSVGTLPNRYLVFTLAKSDFVFTTDSIDGYPKYENNPSPT